MGNTSDKGKFSYEAIGFRSSAVELESSSD